MALTGIRVVEIGQAFAAPFSAEILANLGADVVKVERPGTGDETRRWGPPFWGEDAAVFHSINGNKKSVALDLKNPGDLEACKILIGGADVLIHNMRPGALDKLGLGADDLKTLYPKLIFAEISAYGHVGPLKDFPGYEILSQAFGGIMSITGEPDRDPVRCGPSLCDFGSGMWLAIGILAALHERARTGKGGLVQTSLLETALSWTTVSASTYLASGDAPVRMGGGHHLIAPYGYFETRTRPIMLACASDALFKKLVHALGRPELGDDERFKDNPSRVLHKATIETVIGDILKTESLGHWFDLLNEAGVPCSPVNTIPEVLGHAQTQALGMVQTDPARPEVKSVAFPVSLDGVRPGLKTGAPILGSSTVDAWD
ncbi:CaiB/BaiF CoA transferase family protein [Roseibium sp.]|uniref:CaiB/BaiF CoA transferase family protein n=1 Tax=Roseibium sp. TaxID=1936156 RepID=UPI003D124575